jgi:hypothetical protein
MLKSDHWRINYSLTFGWAGEPSMTVVRANARWNDRNGYSRLMLNS